MPTFLDGKHVPKIDLYLSKIDQPVMMHRRDAVKGTSVCDHLITCVGWHAQRPLTGAHNFAGDKERPGVLLWLLKVVLLQETQMKRTKTLIA